jgi:SAM-dependent methyltransferase
MAGGGGGHVTPGLFEYVTLRVARRFLFSDAMLHRVGRFVPYYRTNMNEVDARPVVELYRRALERAGRTLPPDPTILEIGSGATNSVGYALAASSLAGAQGRVLLFEPYAAFDAAADAPARAAAPQGVVERVQRLQTLAGVAAGSVDLVVSHSVLEHVRDFEATVAELDRVLAPKGLMLHAVDYRDHFFKYPYHFLLFSRAVWDRWLDPGDLPRWRLGDHLRQLRARGFVAQVIESDSMPEEFAKVAPRIDPGFDRADPEVAVARATLLVSRGA